MALDAACTHECSRRSGEPSRQIRYVNYPPSIDTALSTLNDELVRWFVQGYDAPTLPQRFAWPALTNGDNLLLCAPTGTGKTFAAFLPIVNQLLADPEPGLRCLYVAPLKALTRDVAKNLRRALRDMSASCRLRVGVRTGDTSWKVRRRLIEQPPHILLTTPESLAVMLSQPVARAKLRTVRWVIVDEVHALAGSKRGADLSIGLERLEALVAQPLQRIGLSATCTPLDVAAQFLVGAGRNCTVAQVSESSRIDLAIESLPEDASRISNAAIPSPAGFIKRLLDRLDRELTEQRTTLIFANVRSLAERIAWSLIKRYPQRADEIAVHHSSLAPARRRAVERHLKQGKLWAVVSSTSLELGIDIGTIDGVVFVHPPGGAARLVQRLGRSGHRPGQPRRGLALVGSTAELLEATVTAAAGRDHQIERLQIPEQPLDVLCQHLAGMAMSESWSPAEALALVRRAYPYRDLGDEDFRQCINYLSGCHADGTSWLPPRLDWTPDGRFTIASDAISKLLRRNLGTIVSDEPRGIKLVTEENGEEKTVVLGSLDELFADRLQPGDRFLLGGRALEFRRRERSALLVRDAGGQPAPPRWGNSYWRLPAELVRRLYLFRAEAAEILRDGDDALARWLRSQYRLEGPAIDELARYILVQETVSEVPDDRVLLVEAVRHDTGIEYGLHTPLTRAANEALARVVGLRLTRHGRGCASESLAVDLGVLLFVRGSSPLTADDWRQLLAIEDWHADFQDALHDSWLLRERFANVAMTGLMLLRHPQGGRRKVGGRDWAERRLFEQVRAADPDFVLLRQAERETVREACDGAAAHVYLGELTDKMVRLRWLSEPSPFAASWLTMMHPMQQRVLSNAI